MVHVSDLSGSVPHWLTRYRPEKFYATKQCLCSSASSLFPTQSSLLDSSYFRIFALVYLLRCQFTTSKNVLTVKNPSIITRSIQLRLKLRLLYRTPEIMNYAQLQILLTSQKLPGIKLLWYLVWSKSLESKFKYFLVDIGISVCVSVSI